MRSDTDADVPRNDTLLALVRNSFRAHYRDHDPIAHSIYLVIAGLLAVLIILGICHYKKPITRLGITANEENL